MWLMPQWSLLNGSCESQGTMIRRKGGAPPEEDESSEEEDAFSALSSRKAKVKGGLTSSKSEPSAIIPAQVPTSNTSSMKRHHGTSDSRKAKMDALLQELEAEKVSAVRRDRFVPEKKGSFVQPGEELLTTNIFVGNLAPSITEEQMTDLFRQFGDLYSLKIMWPRTPEERARNRNTGFVCFMSREDAEEAMAACDEADPFNVGRRLMMRWGKNVKMVVRQGTGGIVPLAKKARDDSLPDNKRRRMDDHSSSSSYATTSASNRYDPAIHGSDAICVVSPKDLNRARFITTIASFVAKDGSSLEHSLKEKEAGNAMFDFLTFSATNERQREEHMFYKWRVYAFCQGEGFETWRTDPFIMFTPDGKYWVPPSLDRQAALREEQAAMEREQMIRQQKAQRRRMAGRKEFMTGRQLEQAKFGRASGKAADGGARMTDNEIAEFNTLVRERLCASRDAICEAMAFCFEKSGAAKQISEMLKELLLDERPEVSVDTRIARLYLMSDVLYNSQQPGVRNAFLYRDAIERMAPEVFKSMGKHGDGKVGRMTLLKLKSAVSSLLSAWTNWSVYNPAFMDELEAHFDGRELPAKEEDKEQDDLDSQETSTSETEETVLNSVVLDRPRGDWTEVTDDPQESDAMTANIDSLSAPPAENQEVVTVENKAIGSEINHSDMEIDGEPMEEDGLDGESLGDEDLVLEAAVDTGGLTDKRVDETPIEDDIDGEELDGEPFDDDDDDNEESR